MSSSRAQSEKFVTKIFNQQVYHFFLMPQILPYKIKTIFTGIQSSPEVEEYIGKKLGFLEKLLSHYAENTNEALFEVEVGKTGAHHQKGDVYRAEINFIAGGVRLRAVAIQESLNAALDEAKDEMQREMRRHKEKQIAKDRRPARKQT